MGAKVKNPRKKFLWSISFPKHPINTYLFQTCQLPDIEIDQVAHGDVNRDVKTAGRVTVGNLVVEKLFNYCWFRYLASRLVIFLPRYDSWRWVSS